MAGEKHFPRLVAETLTGRSLILPDSLENRLGIVVLAFRRHAQSSVESWLTPVSRVYANEPAITFYEIPLLAGGWRMISGFIDSGMRAGVPAARHDHVATYYGGTERLRDRLQIHDLESAYVYLINQDGEVLWCASGWANESRLASLNSRVTELIGRGGDA